MYKKATYDLYGLDIYESPGGRQYAVGTDEQADAAARLYCRDTLWAFKQSFLIGYCPPAVQKIFVEKALSVACESLCEDANELIAVVVGDRLGELLDDAVSCDGRGHFLASHDGDEVSSDEIDGLPAGLVAFRLN